MLVGGGGREYAVVGRAGCWTYWIDGGGAGCTRYCGLVEKFIDVLLELYVKVVLSCCPEYEELC